MRGLIAAEKFYGTRKKKIAIAVMAITILLVGVIVFPGTLSVPRDARIKKEIGALMMTYNAAWQNKDIEGIMALYSGDPDIIMLKASTGKYFIGPTAIRESYEKEFSLIREITSVEHKILSLSIAGDLVTLAAERRLKGIKDEALVNTACVFSAVVKKRNGGWVLTQTHFP